MKKTVLTLNLAVLLFVINIFSAFAQKPLNNTDVENYLSSLPLLDALAENYEQDIKDQTEEITPPPIDPSDISRTPVTDNLAFIENHPTFDEFKNIISTAGFASADQWANVGDKIMMAYSAYQLKNPAIQATANLNIIKNKLIENLESIKKNQYISTQQKEMLINKIQNSMELINDPNYIDSENISIISPYIARLNSHFKEAQ